VDDRCPIRSDASGSVDPIGARSSMTLAGKGKRAEHSHDCKQKIIHVVFHSE
jgi:hypothetical protein